MKKIILIALLVFVVRSTEASQVSDSSLVSIGFNLPALYSGTAEFTGRYQLNRYFSIDGAIAYKFQSGGEVLAFETEEKKDPIPNLFDRKISGFNFRFGPTFCIPAPRTKYNPFGAYFFIGAELQNTFYTSKGTIAISTPYGGYIEHYHHNHTLINPGAKVGFNTTVHKMLVTYALHLFSVEKQPDQQYFRKDQYYSLPGYHIVSWSGRMGLLFEISLSYPIGIKSKN